MGLNELDTVELFIGLEDEFNIEFPDEVSEKFKDVHDVVQYISRSFWAEWSQYSLNKHKIAIWEK